VTSWYCKLGGVHSFIPESNSHKHDNYAVHIHVHAHIMLYSNGFSTLVVPMSYVAVWGIIEVVQDLRPGLLCIHLANTCQPEEGVCMLTTCPILMLYMGGSDGSQYQVGMPLRLSLDEP